GRKFKPGLRELIVGKSAAVQFKNTDVGSTLKLSGQIWTIVGKFDSGDAHDSELWGDTDVVGQTYRRGGSTCSITMKLTDPKAFEALKATLTSDPRIKVDVSTTRDYYNRQSEQISQLIH